MHPCLPPQRLWKFPALMASFPYARSLPFLPDRFLCTLGADWATGRGLGNSQQSLPPGIPQPVGMGASTGTLVPWGLVLNGRGQFSEFPLGWSPRCPFPRDWAICCPFSFPCLTLFVTFVSWSVSQVNHLSPGPCTSPCRGVRTPPLPILGFWLGLFNKEINRGKTVDSCSIHHIGKTSITSNPKLWLRTLVY